MITPMGARGEIDYHGLSRLVDWYLQKGVSGLFAVCQSSEMFHLTLNERVDLARATVRYADGRVQVIASGHISPDIVEQAEEISAIAETGADAVVLVTNRLCRADDTDGQWQDAVETLLGAIPSAIRLGLYECPYPYKRLVSVESLKWCAQTGRFSFLKDTSCDSHLLRARASALAGTGLRLFNANAATLSESLEYGYAGYSGVMTNFHPELYVALYAAQDRNSEYARRLQDFIGAASVFEKQHYPLNAKYYLYLEGILAEVNARISKNMKLSHSEKLEIAQLRSLTHHLMEEHVESR